MANESFPALVQRFFGHLRSEQEVSPHTVAAYRDTFRLLLRFIADRRKIPIDHITLDAVNPDSTLAFLEHLEKQRHNHVRTRNARLTTTHGYIEADLTMKQAALDQLQPLQWRRAPKRSSSHVLAFLEAL